MMESEKPKTLAMELTELVKNVSANLPPEKLKAFGRMIEEFKGNGVESRALKVGAKAPQFRLRSSQGEWVSSSDLLTRGPLVVSFYRGGWCPFCSLELRAWERHQGDLQALQASFVAISPEVPQKGAETAKSKQLSFPVLSDEGFRVCEQFGLVFKLSPEAIALYRDFGVDLPAINGGSEWTLPVPATFVVGRDGIIRWAFIDADYTKRAEPAEVLNVLRKMR
jgi:peroxiredoxin